MTNEALKLFYKILRDRAYNTTDQKIRLAYRNIYIIFQYAFKNNIEALRQFDVYNDEEEDNS